MNAQSTGYLTVADFVEMVRKKFNSDKAPAANAEKVKQMSDAQSQSTSHQNRTAQHDDKSERYGVDIIV